MQSALSIMGTVMPLVGGLLVDRAGCDIAALLSTSTILLGLSVLVTSLAWSWFNGCLIGLAIIGVGGNWVGTAQEAAVVRLYPGAHGGRKKQGEVAFVFGVLFAIGKVFSFISNGIALHLYDDLGTVARVFSVAIFITIGSVTASVLQWQRRHRWVKSSAKLVVAAKKQPGWSITSTVHYIKHTCYDVVCVLSPPVAGYLTLEFLLGGCWQPFLHLASNMIKLLYNLEAKHAAWLASITVAVPIVMNPVVGILLDRTQQRCWAAIAGCFFLFMAFISMLRPTTTTLASTLPSVFVSLSIALVPLALVTSVPRIVTSKHLGTVLGLHRCLENTGAVWIGALAGVLQDADEGSYRHVVIMFVIISGLALVFSFVFRYYAGDSVDGHGNDIIIRVQRPKYAPLKQQEHNTSYPADSADLIHDRTDDDTDDTHSDHEPSGTSVPDNADTAIVLSSSSGNNMASAVSDNSSPTSSNDQYGSQADIILVSQERNAVKRRQHRKKHREMKQVKTPALPRGHLAFVFITVTLAR
ncbi:major facilitator superfamily domain-containing protein [Syncephalis fuscata]|nr:major facilitator superfamily domain-containing protein [Syncephalis fuscata]